MRIDIKEVGIKIGSLSGLLFLSSQPKNLVTGLNQ